MLKEIFGECIYISVIEPEIHKQIKEIILRGQHNDEYKSWPHCNVDSTFFNTSVLLNEIEPEYRTLMEKEIKKHIVNINCNLDCVLQNLWHNVYKKGDYQEPHHHMDNDNIALSCIYCVVESDAQLYFTNNNFRIHHLSKIQQVYNSENYKEYYYPKMTEGSLIIFPSYLYHGVTPQKSESQRITIAGNIRIIV